TRLVAAKGAAAVFHRRGRSGGDRRGGGRFAWRRICVADARGPANVVGGRHRDAVFGAICRTAEFGDWIFCRAVGLCDDDLVKPWTRETGGGSESVGGRDHAEHSVRRIEYEADLSRAPRLDV